MKKLSRNEMKNVLEGNKPIPPGCQCINSSNPMPPGCQVTGQGFPEYCNPSYSILICCN
ncbi:MAG: hypothetical protein JWR12_2828 [Mucilaginibacter sp.]|nr:hypothetical protein [Mucilaginibacter sp.]